MTADNKLVYQSSDLAQQYGRVDQLQPPEESILNVVRDRLKGARMLDIGVGGGRTTVHFAPLVESYVGIDYSEQMIAFCKQRFEEKTNRLEFRVADVRSLSCFPDRSFDFVLFSYNGLDYIPHENRADALREIHRVLKPGGHFALSTHNLNSLRERLRLRFALNLRAAASRLRWSFRFRWHNWKRSRAHSADYAEVYDGALGYRLRTHYTSPESAIDELVKSGFRDIRTFRLATGEPILTTEELRANTDDWLYSLCTA